MAKTRNVFEIGNVRIANGDQKMFMTSIANIANSKDGDGNYCVGESKEYLFAEADMSRLEYDDDFDFNTFGIAAPIVVAGCMDKKSRNIQLSTVDVAAKQAFDAPSHLDKDAPDFERCKEQAENYVIAVLLFELATRTSKYKKDANKAFEGFMTKWVAGDHSGAQQECISLVECLNKLIADEKIDVHRTIYDELPLNLVLSGELAPTKMIDGEFQVFKMNVEESNVTKYSREDLKTKFILDPKHVYSEEEKMRMHPLPDFYEPSERVLVLLDKIKRMWALPPHQRMVNIMFEGPAGTGKTMDAKAMASMLGLPYYKVTCSANMDETDFTEVMLPVASDSDEIVSIPSDDELFFDPEGSYKELTGKEEKHVTQEMLDKAVEEAKTKNKNAGQVRYINFPSDLVLAFEKGGLCEIQEPTCIADPGVMTVLNSALERGGQLNLSQRTITRNPECIFVITTNPGYNGCRPLNESVRDRMQDTEDVQLPTQAEQVKRLKTYTGCKDSKFLKKLVAGVTTLNDALENEGIISHVSLRGMSDFVLQVMCGFDVDTALDSAIINKVSTDKEVKAMMNMVIDENTQLRSLVYHQK